MSSRGEQGLATIVAAGGGAAVRSKKNPKNVITYSVRDSFQIGSKFRFTKSRVFCFHELLIRFTFHLSTVLLLHKTEPAVVAETFHA
jgi:hypothetical protein